MTAGRPTDYNPDKHPALAEALAREGLTNTEIAEGLGIATSTLQDWKNKFQEFSEAIKRGKQTPDDNVEKSLYSRALGYEDEEEKAMVVGSGQYAKIEIARVKKNVPADPTSCIFWLKNRRPKEWRDKQEVEHSGTISWAELVKNAGDKPD